MDDIMHAIYITGAHDKKLYEYLDLLNVPEINIVNGLQCCGLHMV